MRQIIAQTVHNEKETYSSGFLGRDNAECKLYFSISSQLCCLIMHPRFQTVHGSCRWIYGYFPNDRHFSLTILQLQESSWGGAIEVSILSSYYGIEFDVVDINAAMINRFGEDKNFSMRGFLLYDGIHYDPLFLELGTGVKKTLFSEEEAPEVFEMAQNLAREAKSSRQFTDVGNFTLRCLQCDTQLKGQIQAQSHAKETGHFKFGEV